MLSIFKTVRPLQSKKVREILGDHQAKDKFLKALYKLRDGEDTANFKYNGKKYTLLPVRDLSIKKAS